MPESEGKPVLAEAEKLLLLSESLQKEIEGGYLAYARESALVLTISLGIIVFAAAGSYRLLSGTPQMIVPLITVLVGLTGAAWTMQSILIRRRKQIYRDRRALREIVDLLRESEPLFAEQEHWSSVDRAQFRIRISRFDIGSEEPRRPVFNVTVGTGEGRGEHRRLLGSANESSAARDATSNPLPIGTFSLSGDQDDKLAPVTMDWSILQDEFRNLTSIRAQNLSDSTYKDKWLEACLEVRNVSVDGKTVHVYCASGSSYGGMLISAAFGSEWTAALTHLSAGQKVRIRGRVSAIDKHSVTLEQCRLIAVPEP